jgi:hypothetical protein
MPSYGNVPPEDVEAIQNAARVAASVTRRLPASVSQDWREDAFETILNGILNDWVLNGTTDISEEDEEDLYQLAMVSVDTALAQPEEFRESTFKIALENVMHDWAQNWNAEE